MKFNVIAASLTLAFTLGIANAAQTFQGSELSKYAKVSLHAARTIALKAVPGGTIVDQELEREAGGSGLRYSFDIKLRNTKREVGVDAKTGKVLQNATADKD